MLGNSTEYRGSYMWEYDSEVLSNSENMLDKINGELVTAFNVSGTLEGSLAAIYIAQNAYVKEINILTGAGLAGDIVSEWDPYNKLLPDNMQSELFTALTFGNVLDEDGGTVADPGFSFSYSGNISGAQSLEMSLDGGRLELAGKAAVYSLTIAEGTSLILSGYDTSMAQVTVTGSVSIGSYSTLHTGFTADGAVTGIKTNTATIDEGVTWTFSALPDFYASNSQIVLDSPVESSEMTTGTFRYRLLLDSASPTLNFIQQSSSEGASDVIVGVSREESAYSQYARNETSTNVGNVIYRIARDTSDDMQNLLVALDWSGADGSGVTKGLAMLGPDAYDALARSTLAEQNEFNLLLFRRTLNRLAHRNAAVPGRMSGEKALVADEGRLKKASEWEVWATPHGGGAFQRTHGGLSSWKSTGIGLLVGADRHFDSGLTLGGHVALATRYTRIRDGQEARADTNSAFVGMQVFVPKTQDGVWLTALGHIGIESGNMDRRIHVGDYQRTTESRWSGFAGSLMLGGGKDFTLSLDGSTVNFGPLAWFEYAFLNRPAFSEKYGEAAGLCLDRSAYDSLLMNLGAHVGWQGVLVNGTRLGFDLIAAWRHELLDGNFKTFASFVGYSAHGFNSVSSLLGRDSMLFQGGVRLAEVSGISANLEAGVELFRKDFTAVNVGLNLVWEF